MSKPESEGKGWRCGGEIGGPNVVRLADGVVSLCTGCPDRNPNHGRHEAHGADVCGEPSPESRCGFAKGHAGPHGWACAGDFGYAPRPSPDRVDALLEAMTVEQSLLNRILAALDRPSATEQARLVEAVSAHHSRAPGGENQESTRDFNVMVRRREVWCDFTLMCAHHLPNLPDAHPCHRMHGHNYKVRLFVEGPLDPHLGWIIDYAMVEAVWREVIHARLDHRCLNKLDGLENPTCELLAEWICMHMAIGLPEAVRISRIEVQEEPNSGVVVTL